MSKLAHSNTETMEAIERARLKREGHIRPCPHCGRETVDGLSIEDDACARCKWD